MKFQGYTVKICYASNTSEEEPPIEPKGRRGAGVRFLVTLKVVNDLENEFATFDR